MLLVAKKLNVVFGAFVCEQKASRFGSQNSNRILLAPFALLGLLAATALSPARGAWLYR